MDPISKQHLQQVFSNLPALPQAKTQFANKSSRWEREFTNRVEQHGPTYQRFALAGCILGTLTLVRPLYKLIRGKYTSYVNPVTRLGIRFADQRGEDGPEASGTFISQVTKSQWKALTKFGEGKKDTHGNTAKDRILRSNALKIISNRPDADGLQALLKECTTRQLCQLARGIGKEDVIPGEGDSDAVPFSDLSREEKKARLLRPLSWSPAVFEQLRQVQREMKTPLINESLFESVKGYAAHKASADERIRFESDSAVPVLGAIDQQPVTGPESRVSLPLDAASTQAVRALAADLLQPQNLTLLTPTGQLSLQGMQQIFHTHEDAIALLTARADLAAEAGLPDGMVQTLRDVLQLTDPLVPISPAESISSEQWQTHVEQVQAQIAQLGPEQADTLSRAMDQVIGQFDFKPFSTQLKDIKHGATGPLGGFFNEVFDKYFDQQPLMDRKAMVASLMRESQPSANKNWQLAAMLKGAGPFMHKMLQLFCDKVTDADARDALSTVKTGLTPIDREIKAALLNQIVQDSGGKILAMDGIRSLGAASVGEAVLAQVQVPGVAPGQPDSSRSVVIKLLRPGITERAARERIFMNDAASHHLGMSLTFNGMAEQIEAEMNLKEEAQKVESGQVYNNRAAGLQAMKLSPLVAPRPGYMVVEQAPGSPLQKYIDLCEKAAAGEPTHGFDALEMGQKAVKQLTELGRVWMEQALVGNGFFHGDLHAGNVMFKGDEGQTGLMTVIDFGNAATIPADQHQTLIRLGLALNQGHPRLFAREFRNLLGPTSESLAWAASPIFIEQISGFMRSGNLSASQKLSEILQMYNKHGIEVPPVLSNFSRSMMMLQESVARLNQANYYNLLRSNPQTLALLNRFKGLDEQLRVLPQNSPQAARLRAELDNVRDRINDFQPPEPLLLNEAFRKGLEGKSKKMSLAFRAGLGFTAKVLTKSVSEMNALELKIFECKTKLEKVQDSIEFNKLMGWEHQGKIDERAELEKELKALQAQAVAPEESDV